MKSFTRRVTSDLSDAEYRRLQEALLLRPTRGDVIRGTGGVRKLRWGDERRGKRGAYRIIYYWHPQRSVFLMLYMYEKGEQPDLTAAQRHVLASVVKEEFT
jgi:mRNA-degrading endonuclease RelE of RelBE toxin-antitoxin system